MKEQHKVLLLDDDHATYLVYKRKFADEFGDDVELIHCEYVRDLKDILRHNNLSTIILDQRLHNGTTGLDTIPLIRSETPEVPIILNSAYGSEDLAAKALQAGVDDYVMGNKRDIERLICTVKDAIEAHQKLIETRRALETQREKLKHLCDMQRDRARAKINQINQE